MKKALLGVLVACWLVACTRPVQPAASTPAASGQPGTAPTAWEQIVEAARREGQVTLMGQAGTVVSDALVDAFQRANPGITVDYTGVTGAQMVTKLTTERAAGLYSTDLVVHGTTSVINGLLAADAADPIPPALVGPDDSDPSVWRGGAYDFADEKGMYDLLMLAGVKVPLIYNPTLVSPSELTSHWDLLDPKWKGKIAMLDPRVAGAGLASAIFFYTTPELGKEFMQKLFTQQDVVLTKDDRQLTDWIARGQYLIGLASNDFTALDLKSRGVPIESLPAETLKEGTYVTAAWGSVVLINRAPHPNAARVYLNWLLSRAGQEAIAQATGYPSRRLDTSTEGLRDSVIPKPGIPLRDLSKERYIQQQEEIVSYLKSLIPD